MKLKTNNRLVVALAVLAFGAVVYFFLDVTVLSPAREIQDETAAKEAAIFDASGEADRLGYYQRKLQDYSLNSFGKKTSEVSNAISQRITEMVTLSGMRQDKTAAAAIEGKLSKNAYREIGWKYTLLGTPQQCADMLLLLRDDPYLHKIEVVSIAPTPDGLNVKLDFRYLTPVLADPKGFKLKVNDQATPRPVLTLKKNPKRVTYAGIATRSLFRPYLKVLPKEASGKPDPPAKPIEIPKPTFDYARYRISDLTKYGELQMIEMLDTIEGERVEHKIGDIIGKGEIVRVEHLARTDPDDPKLKTYSRLILKMDKELWSVDLGKTLDKRVRWTKP